MAAWGVIFDWDGVIIDSSAQHKESWEVMASEEGLALPPDHFERSFGMKNHLGEITVYHMSRASFHGTDQSATFQPCRGISSIGR